MSGTGPPPWASMRTLLRRPTRALCFFCQTSISPPPPQPLSFLCPHCACWNHYDANGNILSDDPAMHDESLNGRSFARRGASSLSSALLSIFRSLRIAPAASPRKDRLLTTFGNAPFCSVCQSNQRLVNSLLSSYLPPSDDVRPYPYAVLKAVKALTTYISHRFPAGSRLCTSSRGLRGLQSLHLRALPARLREVHPPCRRGDSEEGRHGALERARIVAERE